MSKCKVCDEEIRVGTEHVLPDLAVVCSSCSKGREGDAVSEHKTVVIGLLDRSGCAGCAMENNPLHTCAVTYVDLLSECVTCDMYEGTERGTG